MGVAVRGFDTRQSRDDAGTGRVQNIRYYSVNTYWIRAMDRDKQWTVGVRVDDFRNRERTASDPAAEFDFLFKTMQVYSDYYRPVTSQQALELGVYLGDVIKRRDYRDTVTADWRQHLFEAILRTGWDIFSIDHSTALALGVSWNLDDLIHDSFDGGSVRFRAEF